MLAVFIILVASIFAVVVGVLLDEEPIGKDFAKLSKKLAEEQKNRVDK